MGGSFNLLKRFPFSSYLRGVAESDERLKIIMSFNSKQAILSLYNSSTTPGGGGSSSGSDRGLSPVPPASERRPRSSSSSSHQFNSHQYWFSLGQLVVNKGLSFEEFSIDAILIEPPPSSSSSSPSSTPFVLSSQAGVRATSSPSFPDTGLKRNTINNSCNNNMPLFHLDMFRKLDSMPLISLFESWGAINLGRGLFMRFVFDEDHQPHLLPSASNGGGVPLSRQHSDEIPLTDRTTTTTTLSSPYLSTSSSLKKIPAGLNDIPIGFCFLRVAVENDCIVQIKLTFSSLTADKRQRVVDSLLADLKRIETISGCFYLCKKPMRQLLVSSTPSALTSNGRLKSVMAAKRNASNPAVVIATTAASPILYSQSSSAESSPATNQPGSKSSSSTSSSQDTLYLRKSQDIILLSSYLKHIKNIWLADIDSQKLMASAPNVGGSSSDDFVHSAFTLMARRRLSDGFYPVARSMTSILFYKEVELLNSSSTTSSTSNHPEGDVSPTPPHQDSVVCSLQYELVMNLGLGEVVSEIWWEPILKAESTTSSSSSSSSLPYSLVPVFQTIVTDIVAKDRQIVDYLYSVALVQYLACKPILPPPLDGWISSESSRQLIPRRLLRMFPNPGNLNIMKTLFEISSVLKRSSGVFVEAFKAPCIIVRAATTTTYNNNSDENNSRYAQQIDGSFSSSSDHGECSPSPSLEDNGQMSSSESSLLPARSDAPDTQPFSSPAAGFFTPLESPAIPIVPVTPPSTAAFTGTAGGMVAGVSQRLYSTFQSSSLRNEQLHFILPCLEEFDTAIALDILDCRSDRLMELIALNRFFEQSLIDFFTDAAFDPLKVDICDGSKMSVDYLCNFSNYIKDSILNHQRLVLPESCRSSKCLVKAKDENNFLLVFVPKNVIKDTKLSDDGANVGLDSISLTLFECISLAQDASDIISNDDSHDMFLTHEIHIISPIIKGFAGESSQKRYSVSAARSWRNPGVLDDGDRQDEVPSQSRFTSSFFLEADKAFSIALAKTLHFCLLYCTYLPVNADMVEAAIENECSDTFVSQIDITRFLNINYLLGSSVNQE